MSLARHAQQYGFANLHAESRYENVPQIQAKKTFFGLNLETQRDVILFLVEEHLSREILESIAAVGEFDIKPGTGIAFQVDVEDAVGIVHQMTKLRDVVEEEL